MRTLFALLGLIVVVRCKLCMAPRLKDSSNAVPQIWITARILTAAPEKVESAVYRPGQYLPVGVGFS